MRRRGWHTFLVNVLVTQGDTFVLGEEGESNEVVHFLVEVLGAHERGVCNREWIGLTSSLQPSYATPFRGLFAAM
jgi:hypothetical protein